MEHLFSAVPNSTVERSVFKRKCNHLTTLNPGYLVPIFCDEVLPGDSMKMDMSQFGRLMSPTIKVPVDNCYINYQFYFVPSRIVWDNWKKFQGEQIDPGDSIDYLVPTLRAPSTGFAVDSIADHLGLPIGVPYIEVNALPFRAYNLIYNEYYRDENLIDSVTVNRTDTDDYDNYTLLKRGKRHDYFTSCLPFAQKGAPVSIPLTGNAPVVGNGLALGFSNGTVGGTLNAVSNNYAFMMRNGYGLSASTTPVNDNSWLVGNLGVTDDADKSGLIADLSNVAAVNINDLRTAVQLQRLLERDARGGSRYAEILRAHWHIVPEDASLQRPQYIGGDTVRMNLSTVPQTSGSVGSNYQADLSSFGLFASSSHTFSQTFLEHGYIIGLACVYTDMNYQYGIERMWSRRTRYDFYMPVLAHLGEQAVLNKEIFAQGFTYDSDTGNYTEITTNVGTDAEPILYGDSDVFGYQERWAEYRYKPNYITGAVRSSAGQSLDIWHYAQSFENLPTLSQDFIEENPEIDRAVAVTSENVPNFLFNFDFDYKCARKMPVYSVPGLMDHF